MATGNFRDPKQHPGEQHQSQLRGEWFAIRVINPWNNLPDHVVDAPTIATFSDFIFEFARGITNFQAIDVRSILSLWLF